MSNIDRLRRKPQRQLSQLQPVGFHGDKYLLMLVNVIMQSVNCFVETGTNVGSTLAYVARTYPDVTCYSCEPDYQAYKEAIKNSRGVSRVFIYNETSQVFLDRLEKEHSYLFGETILFWLDAHGYGFEWPLRYEVNFITTKFKSAYILIDDFLVPGSDIFGFDSYKGQECSFKHIQSALNSELSYSVYYPAYTKKTSTFHPLRGWGLIALGQHNDKRILETMGDNIRLAF